jgi:hypothetical protein
LREWVRQGGHLVIPAYRIDRDALSKWLPLRYKTESEAETETKAPSCRNDLDNQDKYRQLVETGPSAGPGFRVSRESSSPLEPKPDTTSEWSADGPDGPELLRVTFGQGSVTAIGIWFAMTNNNILEADHAQAWAAALRIHSGMSLWFVDEENREALPVWFWQQAWIVLLLGLLALSAALWRAAPRFGPKQAIPRVERRSMAEQIIGTAHFWPVAALKPCTKPSCGRCTKPPRYACAATTGWMRMRARRPLPPLPACTPTPLLARWRPRPKNRVTKRSSKPICAVWKRQCAACLPPVPMLLSTPPPTRGHPPFHLLPDFIWNLPPCKPSRLKI